MSSAIEIENLSKRYILSRHHREPYLALRDVIPRTLRSAVQRLHPRPVAPPPAPEEFWALRDVSFAVRDGDTIGIIGRNGAGKSTLLKILSRITDPTSGRVRLRGRVASLLEVGTGFHAELTGRENVFLNGAILGMTRLEIRRRFDEIVAFAEIEKFLDTPVKHYSSGMYMRLAFAVAAHLEPDILVVDEVLAVGDAQFQRKCLNKMSDVARSGRTVLFVSHNLPAVMKLCSRAIVLREGTLSMASGTAEAVAHYLALDEHHHQRPDPSRSTSSVPDGQVRFVAWELLGSTLGLPHSCRARDECSFRFTLVCRRTLPRAHLGFTLRAADDTILLSGHNLSGDGSPATLNPGVYWVDWQARLPLPPGQYRVSVGIASEDEAPRRADDWQAYQTLEVVEREATPLPPRWRGLINEHVACRVREVSPAKAVVESR
jgi:lipopolysaccharide transport system ATP-binding protein